VDEIYDERVIAGETIDISMARMKMLRRGINCG